MNMTKNMMRVGWGQTDMTPPEPVLVSGQFHARVSEGVADPITATVLILDAGTDHAVMVSCDLVSISNALRDSVRERCQHIEGLNPAKIIFNATHTHTGPEVRPNDMGGTTAQGSGVELPIMNVTTLVAFMADKIAEALQAAWKERTPGTIAYGQGQAVVGRNRRWVTHQGSANMYGNTDTPDFSHIEGFEDHSVGVLATYGDDGTLTGLVVNVPCPSQVGEEGYELSADYWYETRCELRKRFGASLFVLGQCSAAGDQSPHLLFDKRAELRMLALKGRTVKQEIACRLTDAVGEILPAIETTKKGSLKFRHQTETLELPLAKLTSADVETAEQEAAKLQILYDEEITRLEADPSLRDAPRWYVQVTMAYRRMGWLRSVAKRFEEQDHTRLSSEVHVIRLGDAIIATNPFEYYLDYGIRIKARSPAEQTLLVQLAGPGTYVPSARSQAGGGYGSIPASNPVGPEGGHILAERTLEIIQELWETEN